MGTITKCTFRIRPKQGPHYFTVHVFESKSQMHRWYLSRCFVDGKLDQSKDLDFAGLVMPHVTYRFVGGVEERKPEIGTVLLTKGRLGSGLIAHEMGHCAFWYDRLINGNEQAEYSNECGEAEERFLYLLTELVSQCVNKLYKNCFYENQPDKVNQ